MAAEKSLQDACLTLLRRRRIYHSNTHGNAWEARGRPDIYICYRGRFIGVELKRGEDSEPAPLQRKHLREIEESGGIGIWITELRELAALLERLSK